MKLIKLRGKYAVDGREFAQVDDEDYEYLNQFNWYVAKSRRNFYAHSGFFNEKTKNIGKIVMHRVVMNVKDKKIAIDHKDHNGLNNQKSNLRICDNYQNAKNKSSKKNGTSIYLGVWRKGSKWGSSISIGSKINNKKYFLGSFKNEIDAAKAYDAKAKELHGEFANLNFK